MIHPFTPTGHSVLFLVLLYIFFLAILLVFFAMSCAMFILLKRVYSNSGTNI